MKKDHAEHNKKLCDKLHLEKGFPDWVVTTAFYSAINFIDYKIFPTKNTTKPYQDIAEAKLDMGQNISAHKVRGMLVKSELSSHIGSYKFLKDRCHTARYVNYKISETTVNQARTFLDSIIKDCTI